MRFEIHVLSSFMIFFIVKYFQPELSFGVLGLLIISNLIDLDHGFNFKKILENYGHVNSYPLHKFYFIIPIGIILLLSPLFALGIGLLLHFIFDYAENFTIFGRHFKWV